MGALQNFFIGFVVFSLFISGFIMFQKDVFDSAKPNINVTFNKTSKLSNYTKLDDLYSTASGSHEDVFNPDNSTSEDATFDEISVYGSARSIFSIAKSLPRDIIIVLSQIAYDLHIPPFFVNAALIVILALLVFGLGSLLLKTIS